jgi:hypothetical protein
MEGAPLAHRASLAAIDAARSLSLAEGYERSRLYQDCLARDAAGMPRSRKTKNSVQNK